MTTRRDRPDPHRQLLGVLRRPPAGAREMVEGGPIDVLTGDWLAELTMLILSRIRAKRPGGGFAGTFVTQMEQVMGTCLDRWHQGRVERRRARSRRAAPRPSHEVADRLGLAPTIAYVDGDDLLPRLAELVASGALRPFVEGGERRRPHQARHRQRLLRVLGDRRGARPRRRHRDHRPRHRRRRHVRSGGVAPRLGARRLGRARRRRSSPATSSSAARRRPVATTRSSPRCRAWPGSASRGPRSPPTARR